MPRTDKAGDNKGSGLSIRTLLISSASAVVAALVVPLVWEKGTLVATALTPIVVAIAGNLLEKPVSKAASIRIVGQDEALDTGPDEDSEKPRVLRPGEIDNPLPKEATLILPDGIDLDEPATAAVHGEPAGTGKGRLARLRPRLTRRRVRIAVATGALGFLIGGGFLTFSELVAGGSISLDKRTTLFPEEVNPPTPEATATPEPTVSATPTAPATPTAGDAASGEPTQTPTPGKSATATPTASATPDDDAASPTPTTTATPTATAPAATPTP